MPASVSFPASSAVQSATSPARPQGPRVEGVGPHGEAVFRRRGDVIGLRAVPHGKPAEVMVSDISQAVGYTPAQYVARYQDFRQTRQIAQRRRDLPAQEVGLQVQGPQVGQPPQRGRDRIRTSCFLPVLATAGCSDCPAFPVWVLGYSLLLTSSTCRLRQITQRFRQTTVEVRSSDHQPFQARSGLPAPPEGLGILPVG